jgi:hypothetical protein
MAATEPQKRVEESQWMPLSDDDLASIPKPPTVEEWRAIRDRVNKRNNPIWEQSPN